MLLSMRLYRVTAALGVAVALAGPAGAWTPTVQQVIAAEAAQHVPADLARQIERHEKWYRQGVLAPFEHGEAARHVANEDGSGQLEAVIAVEVATAIEAIRQHRPFHQIVYRLGVVAHYVADANNPLNTSRADPREPDYATDYLYYLEGVEPRLPVVFYGLTPGGEDSLDAILEATLERSRGFYPAIGREYRRIAFGSGRQQFDDKSTAFGVAAVSFSQAITDVIQVLRHVWLRAGGIDERRHLPRQGERLVQLPRRAEEPEAATGR